MRTIRWAHLTLLWRRACDSELAYRFRQSPVALISAATCLLCFLGALLAPWIAPHQPFDLKTLDLLDSLLPPIWLREGKWAYLLGTDSQGRDMLSAILYGARISLLVGVSSVLFSLLLGISLGLLAGYAGGKTDACIMRIADIQLAFPAILIALLIDGIGRLLMPREVQAEIAVYVLILAIGFSGWVQYARTVRGSTMVEKHKEYVQAARVTGRHPVAIMLLHVLPNVIGPVFIIATLHIGTAVITEATLSYLGVGVPPTRPSLGMLIRNGNDFLFSGEWWIVVFPGLMLVIMVLSINVFGNWLREGLSPKAPIAIDLDKANNA